MSIELRQRIYAELDALVLIDPHTHINPHSPASTTLADILGYHYYTELAHSAGMAKSQIEEPGLAPKEKVARLMANLGPIDNTIQYSWFVEMAQSLLGFQGDSIGAHNWEELYDLAAEKMAADDWADQVLNKSKLEAVFLTNDFDDPLVGFDTERYIPCLRTDDLVFQLAKVETVERLERATGTSVNGATSLRDAISNLFTHFKANGARACAISLPPDFTPARVSLGRAQTALDALLMRGLGASEADRRAVANFVFWTLAEFCAEYKLPFDLMIGVNRGVYEQGVHQGRDLYDSRVSLIQYKDLFNAFRKVVFPVSVLSSVTNQELTSYAWIFPNVVTNGHWWYSNTPTFIEHDLACRLEAVPRTKQIGYYSDMYKLEFALPKFNMYKRILAKVLAERYVVDRGWSESRAVEFGKQLLRGNVESLFGFNGEPWTPNVDMVEEPPAWTPQPPMPFASAIGMGGMAAVGVAAVAMASEPPPFEETMVPLEPAADIDFGDDDDDLDDMDLESELEIDLDEELESPEAELEPAAPIAAREMVAFVETESEEDFAPTLSNEEPAGELSPASDEADTMFADLESTADDDLKMDDLGWEEPPPAAEPPAKKPADEFNPDDFNFGPPSKK